MDLFMINHLPINDCTMNLLFTLNVIYSFVISTFWAHSHCNCMEIVESELQSCNVYQL